MAPKKKKNPNLKALSVFVVTAPTLAFLKLLSPTKRLLKTGLGVGSRTLGQPPHLTFLSIAGKLHLCCFAAWGMAECSEACTPRLVLLCQLSLAAPSSACGWPRGSSGCKERALALLL